VISLQICSLSEFIAKRL